MREVYSSETPSGAHRRADLADSVCAHPVPRRITLTSLSTTRSQGEESRLLLLPVMEFGVFCLSDRTHSIEIGGAVSRNVSFLFLFSRKSNAAIQRGF